MKSRETWNRKQGRLAAVRVSMKYGHVYHAGVTRRSKHLRVSCEFSRNRWQQRAGPRDGPRDEEKRTSARVRSAKLHDEKRTETVKERRGGAIKTRCEKKDRNRDGNTRERGGTYLGPVEPFSDRLHRRAVEDVGKLTGESSLRLLRPKHLRHSETCHRDLSRNRHTTRHHQSTAYETEFFRQVVSPLNVRSSTTFFGPRIRNCAWNVNRASVRLTDEYRLQRRSSLLRMRPRGIMVVMTYGFWTRLPSTSRLNSSCNYFSLE